MHYELCTSNFPKLFFSQISNLRVNSFSARAKTSRKQELQKTTKKPLVAPRMAYSQPENNFKSQKRQFLDMKGKDTAHVCKIRISCFLPKKIVKDALISFLTNLEDFAGF